MYIGHARLCLSACLSLTTFPHYCTDPHVTWGNGMGCSLVVGGFAFGVQVSLLWQQSAECEMSASACTRCVPGFVGETGPRAGMPSVRPNAMKDRRRQLEALNRYEDKLRAAAHRSSPASVPAASLSSVPRRYSSAGMCVHVLDISEAVESGRVSWLPIRGVSLTGSPDEATFYSLVAGRGELMMFGGIRGDARNLQRGSTTLQPQAVSSDVNFLSFRPKHLLWIWMLVFGCWYVFPYCVGIVDQEGHPDNPG